MWQVISAKTGKPVARLNDKFGIVEAGVKARWLLAQVPETLPLYTFGTDGERHVTRMTTVGCQHPDYDEALSRWLADRNMILAYSGKPA